MRIAFLVAVLVAVPARAEDDGGAASAGATAGATSAATSGAAAAGASVSASKRDRPDAVDLRVQRFADDAVAASRAAGGDVAPAWRDVERALAAAFHPAPGDVTTQTPAQLLAAQLRAAFTGANKPRDGSGPMAQPASWRRTEVEVSVDAAGRVTARVVAPSGMAALDRQALAAAQSALASSAARLGPRNGERARFAVESAVSVTPPDPVATMLPGSTRPSGAVVRFSRIHFDETTARVSAPDYIGKTIVHTRVSLIGLARPR